MPKRDPQEILVSNLEFDYQNPRLPTTTRGTSNEHIIRYLLAEGKVTDLMQSIGQQGYFGGEPLIAIPSKGKKYIVVEGNRRLAALKLLNRLEIAPIKTSSVEDIINEAKFIPKEVPVIIYDTRDEVLEYLGYRHITGVDDWDPLAKARYLKQVALKYSRKPFDERISILSKIIGSGKRADYVKKLLLGYSLYEEIRDNEFYNIPNLSEETLEFSILTTAVSYKKISDYIGLDEDAFSGNLRGIKKQNLKNLITWMFEKNDEGFTRLGESRNLKILSAVVGSTKALRAFVGGKSLDVARLYTSEPRETFTELISMSLNRIKDARELLYLIEDPEESVVEDLKEIQGISKTCISDLQAKLSENEE